MVIAIPEQNRQTLLTCCPSAYCAKASKRIWYGFQRAEGLDVLANMCRATLPDLTTLPYAADRILLRLLFAYADEDRWRIDAR